MRLPMVIYHVFGVKTTFGKFFCFHSLWVGKSLRNGRGRCASSLSYHHHHEWRCELRFWLSICPFPPLEVRRVIVKSEPRHFGGSSRRSGSQGGVFWYFGHFSQGYFGQPGWVEWGPYWVQAQAEMENLWKGRSSAGKLKICQMDVANWKFRLCFLCAAWLGGVQPCSAFNWRRPFGDTFRSTKTSSKAFQDVLGPFCIGWLLRLGRKNATFLGVHFPPESRLELTKPNQPLVLGGEAGNSRSAFNWRQRGITFSFFSRMTPLSICAPGKFSLKPFLPHHHRPHLSGFNSSKFWYSLKTSQDAIQ